MNSVEDLNAELRNVTASNEHLMAATDCHCSAVSQEIEMQVVVATERTEDLVANVPYASGHAECDVNKALVYKPAPMLSQSFDKVLSKRVRLNPFLISLDTLDSSDCHPSVQCVSVEVDEPGKYQSKTVVFEPPAKVQSSKLRQAIPAISTPTFVPSITAHLVQPSDIEDKMKQGDEEQLVGVDGAMVADFQVGVYNVDLPRRYTSYMAFSVVMCLLCWCCNPLVTLFCVCPALLCSCLACNTRSYRTSRQTGKCALCCNITALVVGAAKCSCIVGAVCLPITVIAFVALVGVAIGSAAVTEDAFTEAIVGYFDDLEGLLQL